MNEIFGSEIFDERPCIKTGEKIFTLKEIKSFIRGKINVFRNLKENIVILPDDNFGFVINFFAGIFTDKNLYLITDTQILKDFPTEYDIADNIFNENFENFDFPKIDISKPCINFFTSGSTGIPKCIPKSLENLYFEAIDGAKEFNLPEKNLVFSSTTTMCHLFGLSFHFMFPFFNGYLINSEKVLYPDNIDLPDGFLVSTPSFLNFIEKYGSEFVAAPKYIITAGSKLPQKTFAYLEKRCSVIEIYGSSEGGIIGYSRNSGDNSFKPFPNVKIEGNNLISPYCYGNKTEINDNLEFFENEKFTVKGRKDGVLKINDKRVDSSKIENNLKQSGFIEDAICLKVGEKLACLCVPDKNGKKFLIEKGYTEFVKKLKQIAKEEIIPAKWRFCGIIPVNSRGKRDIAAAKRYFDVKFSYPVILNEIVSSGKASFKLYFPKESNFYKGHFPGCPITPGVVLLFTVKELTKLKFGRDISTGQFKRIKFSKIIKPEETVTLNLEIKENGLFYEYELDGKTAALGIFPVKNVFERT